MYFNGRLFFGPCPCRCSTSPSASGAGPTCCSSASCSSPSLGVVALGRLVDRILFSGYRRQPVEKPVFIIAPPRSGTALTQNLLQSRRGPLPAPEDVPDHLPGRVLPAVLRCRGLDRPCARASGRTPAGLVREEVVRGWDDLHKMRLNQPEEDDALFLYAFASEAIYMLFPFVKQLWEAGFPDALPPEDRVRLMRYYRSCLQRHLYANGPTRTLLSKATQSCGTLDSLNAEFPDARFITIIRHPYRSLASHVSLFVPVGRRTPGDYQGRPGGEGVRPVGHRLVPPPV